MNDAVMNWLMSYDTGLSSRTIVAVMEEDRALAAALLGSWGVWYPHDPADLGRCIRLLDIAPEYRERLSEMGHVSQVWAELVNHWEELESLYREEYPSGRAPKCFARMREIIDKVDIAKRG